ncbi:MAG: AlpA family phage regulatory protein [Novosphingobium sp.]|nr:AlpA family phage regulatory protein [Novosphingobium sp.]
MNAMSESAQFLSIKTVVRMTSLSRATIYRRIASNTFPAQIDLGGRRIAFRRDEIERWIANPKNYKL